MKVLNEVFNGMKVQTDSISLSVVAVYDSFNFDSIVSIFQLMLH